MARESRHRGRRMTYFKVDDGFWAHPKVEPLSTKAVALWCKAGSWSARYLTDGHIPARTLSKLDHADSEAGELVRAGLWDLAPDGFVFHQWEEHQQTKAEVEEEREKWRNEKRRQRTAKSKAKSQMSGTESGELSATVSRGPLRSDPILSSPIRSETSSETQKEISRPAPKGPVAPPASERVRLLEARYREGLCEAARHACALSRRNGKMADTVWLTTLEALDAHEVAHAEAALETFADRYADGAKDERYLIGICRGNAKGGRQGAFTGKSGRRDPSPGTTHLDFQQYPSVDEQLAKAGM